MRDIDRPDYPLPCDPVTGMAWWRFNLRFCLMSERWRTWQSQKRKGDLIPVIRWVIHSPIPKPTQ